MAKSKSRLGRGLESLIAGSVSTTPAKPGSARPAAAPKKASNPPAPKKKKSAKVAHPGKGSKGSKGTQAGRHAEGAARPKAAQASAPAKRPGRAHASPGNDSAPATKEDHLEGTIPLPGRATPTPAESPNGLREIPIQQVKPNPHQPRRHFDETSLAELAESIRSEGLLQPIVVRTTPEGFELIAGERRWRACQSLKMKRIPARILEATETSSAVMSLIENLQRENLDPIEEARGYACLIADFSLTQESVAERVGKARASVANSLRLLQLDPELQQYIGKRMLSVGHAKVLLGLDDTAERNLVARQVIERQLSVRELEKRLQSRRRGGSLTSNSLAPKSLSPAEAATVADLEKRLTQSLSTRVQVQHSPKKGKILIEYYGNEDLQRILECFGVSL